MGDAERFRTEVCGLMRRLEIVQRKLRELGVARAFINRGQLPNGSMECWLLIERMLEISEILTEEWRHTVADTGADFSKKA